MKEIDVSLVCACQCGDKEAFLEIYKVCRDPMYRLAYRFTKDAESAQDLTQEIFIKVFEKLNSFRCESAFSTWLYRLATNLCLNYQREAKPMAENIDEMEGELVDLTANPAGTLERKELSQHLEEAIAALPDNLRVVFILVAVEDTSYAEAANILGLKVEAVRMRMSRARQKLKEHLQDYLEEWIK